MPDYHPSVDRAIAAETAAMEVAILSEKMMVLQATGVAQAFVELAAAQRARADWVKAQIMPRVMAG